MHSKLESEFFLEETRSSSVATSPPKAYNPWLVKEPAIYRRFANVAPTKEGIQAFANEFGKLTTLQAENFVSWDEELAKMHDLTLLWDLCLNEDVVVLKQHIHWENDFQAVKYCSRPQHIKAKKGVQMRLDRHDLIDRRPSLLQEDSTTDWLDRFSPPDVFLPAIIYLQEQVNQQLMRVNSVPQLLWDPRSEKLDLGYLPRDLRSLVWTQFAFDIKGVMSYRACANCGRWIRLVPHNARTNRRVCSKVCHNKLFRDRQAKGLVLFEEGRSLKHIAAEVETSLATVRGWVKVGKKKGR